MSHWNYRVFKQNVKEEEDFVPEFTIREAYYSEGEDFPWGFTQGAKAASSEDLEGLKWVLQKMLEACDKPIVLLDENGKFTGMETL